MGNNFGLASQFLANWDGQGRFVCSFHADAISQILSLYKELESATSYENQKRFQNLYFDIGEVEPLHHSLVVFKDAGQLAQFIAAQYRQGIAEKISNAYQLTGHPVLCYAEKPIYELDAFRALVNTALDINTAAFGWVKTKHKSEKDTDVLIRPVAVSENGPIFVDPNIKQYAVIALSPSIEIKEDEWRLNLPVQSSSHIISSQSADYNGHPALMERNRPDRKHRLVA